MKLKYLHMLIYIYINTYNILYNINMYMEEIEMNPANLYT